MPKTSSTLTGGTGDVNPQWYRLAIPSQPQVSASAGTVVVGNATVTYPTPVPKFPEKKDRAIVMELLKIMWAPDQVFNPVSAQAGKSTLTAQLLTASSPTVIPSNDGRVVDFCIINEGVSVATGGPVFFGEVSTLPIIHDLTDETGHGVLIATDNITLVAQAAATGIGGSATVTGWQCVAFLLYRFKEISLAEYIGIVQSQQ